MKKTIFILVSLILLSACNSASSSLEPQQLGHDGAQVLIEEFGDLQCPNCAVISPQVEAIVKENSNSVQLYFYHYPLSTHIYAFVAAEAAECAGDQDKFWEYANLIYKNQSDLNDDFLYKVADSVQLNRQDFDVCMEERKYKEKIQAHMAEGAKRNIPGTPTFFVNGKSVKWTTAEAFEDYLKQAEE